MLRSISVTTATILLIGISSGLSAADDGFARYEAIEKKAYKGDYQSQRNLAYILSTEMPYNPILGCAWRLVILESGDKQVDHSDVSNKQFFCDKKLSPEEQKASQAQAREILSKIGNKKKK